LSLWSLCSQVMCFSVLGPGFDSRFLQSKFLEIFNDVLKDFSKILKK